MIVNLLIMESKISCRVGRTNSIAFLSRISALVQPIANMLHSIKTVWVDPHILLPFLQRTAAFFDLLFASLDK